MTAPTLPPAKLAVYLRVSSEEQRVAGTIETQRGAAERYCLAYDHTPYGWYADDGVSGTVPFAARPEGARLMADASAGHITTVLIWRLDRFGRNAYEILAALRALQALGVRLVSITEAFDTETPAGRLQINMLASIAEFERDSIVQRATAGISRHLREGGWSGGQIPYGYLVTGREKDARLALNRELLSGPDGSALGMSEADVVELLYHLATAMRWSLVRIADHLQALGVPTATRWRGNRVHAILTNPTNKGLATYGRRGKDDTSGVTVPVPAIVTPEVWMAAQDALKRRQLFATRNSKHAYLLHGLVTCGLCGHLYGGTRKPTAASRQERYYVCNAKRNAVALYGHADAQAHRCPSTAVRAAWLEARIWQEVEGYLRDPGPVLEKLAAKLAARASTRDTVRAAALQAERQLAAKVGEQDAVLTLYRRGRIDAAALDKQLDAIQQETATLREQVAAAQAQALAFQASDERLRGAGALLRRLQVRLKSP
jgi:site-specific DNA recombinase